MKIRHYLLAMVLSCYTVTSFAELNVIRDPIYLSPGNREITLARDNFRWSLNNTFFTFGEYRNSNFFNNWGYTHTGVASGIEFKTVLDDSGQRHNGAIIYKIPGTPLGIKIMVNDTWKTVFYNQPNKNWNEVFYFPSNSSGAQGLGILAQIFILDTPEKDRVYFNDIFHRLDDDVLIGYVRGFFWKRGRGREILEQSKDVPIYLRSFTIRQNIASCTYRGEENLNVRLPTVSKRLFTGVGTEVFGGTFTLNLDQCGVLQRDGQLTQNNPLQSVKVTFSDATDSANRTDKLTLTSDSTATGVKLKIYPADNSSIQPTPVSFGPESRVRGNPNQIDMNYDSRSNTVNQRYVVKYVQDNAQVTAGTVNAAATFTFSYQ